MIRLSCLLCASLLTGCFLCDGASSLQAQSAASTKTAQELSAAIPDKALKTITLEPGASVFDRMPESVQDLKQLERATTSRVPEYQAATVGIQVGGGQGSGIVISPDGIILTAAHVVGEAGAQVTIVFQDGRRHRAHVTGVDATADAAIVRLDGRGPYPFIPMAENHFAIPGRWVIAIGHPNGYESTRRPVVRLGRVIQCTDKTVQTDCSLVGGDSGGPLFDLQGRVVGIHSRIGINNSINYHVPVQVYLNDWDNLTTQYVPDPVADSTPKSQKAYLGIRGRDAASSGCLVTEVTPGGPAEKGGLQRGDLLTHCDGEPVRSFADLVTILKSKKPDEELEMTIKRGGRKQTLTVVLGATEI